MLLTVWNQNYKQERYLVFVNGAYTPLLLLPPFPKIPYEDFFSDYISNMRVESVVQDLLTWKDQEPSVRIRRFFLCEHAFLISTDLKKVNRC